MSMQRGLIVSVALHSGVVLAFAIGLNLRSDRIDQKMVEIPVEIVRFAPESNPPPGKKPVPKEDRKPDADKSTADRAPSARKREDLKQARLKTEKTEETKPPKPDPKPKAEEKPKVAEKPKPAPPKKAEAKPKPEPKKPDPPKRDERKVANARPPAPERKAEAKPKPKPDPKPDPKPEKKTEARKKPEPKPDPKPAKKAEKKPEPKPKPTKKAEAKPTPEKTPEAKKKPEKRQVADARPKAKSGAPKRAPKPKSGSDFDSILKSVDKMRTKRDANKNQTRAQAPRGSKTNVRSRPLTISEIDAVRRQIRPCWNFPAGAKNASELRVQVRLWMNRDGTVQKAQILDRGRMSRDSFFRAAALAAYRAVKNPRCGPLKLPREKFDRWKVMVIEFDPSEMGDGL